MLFSKTKQHINADIFIKTETVEIVGKSNNAGVMLDLNLKFQSHVKRQ